MFGVLDASRSKHICVNEFQLVRHTAGMKNPSTRGLSRVSYPIYKKQPWRFDCSFNTDMRGSTRFCLVSRHAAMNIHVTFFFNLTFCRR